MRYSGKTLAATAALMLVAGQATAEFKFAGVDVAPDKTGTMAELQDMTTFCGTKPMKVALSDGWGENGWRKIVRAEFVTKDKTGVRLPDACRFDVAP